MKHTKEPWKVQNSEIITDYEPTERRTHGYSCTNDFICDLDDGEYHQYINQVELTANAERIVACVNACAGITTEALESGLIKHLLDEKLIQRSNPFSPVPVATYPQLKKGMKYLGKPIFVEDADGKD